MYTYGKQPYEGMRGDEVVQFVESGKCFTDAESILYIFKFNSVLSYFNLSYFIFLHNLKNRAKITAS